MFVTYACVPPPEYMLLKVGILMYFFTLMCLASETVTNPPKNIC